MAKSSDDIKELQRCINRLLSLDGELLCIGGAAYLVRFEALLDPEPLLSLLGEEKAPSEVLAALRGAFSLRAEPIKIDALWLASAQHDLKILEESPKLFSIGQKAPRLFKGLALDAHWLKDRRERLDRLRARFPATTSQSGFAGALSLILAIHGEASAQAIQAIYTQSLDAGASRRAKRRVELFAQRLEGKAALQEPQLEAFLEDCAQRAKEIWRLPLRNRRKKLWQLIDAVFSWPAAPEKSEPPEELPPSLPAAVRFFSRQLLLMREPNQQKRSERLGWVLARYGLLFVARDRSFVLEESQLRHAYRRFSVVKKALAGQPLSLAQVFGLLRVPLSRDDSDAEERLSAYLKTTGAWVSQGLPVSSLQRCDPKNLKEVLSNDWDTETARAYFEWVERLTPHYQQQGIKLALTPEVFTQLKSAKRKELAVLAHCLIEHHAAPSQKLGAKQVATLDATLALFRKLPAKARACLRDLEQAPKGLGEKLFPALSGWLEAASPDHPEHSLHEETLLSLGLSGGGAEPGEERSGEAHPNPEAGRGASLLDRYLHLCGLLGEPQAPSKALLRDFSRATRRNEELRYLSSLQAPNEAQQQMIERLSQQEPPPDPGWTRRRLAERIDELLARLYQRRLDEIMVEVFRAAFGIQLQRVTSAWRDVFRFFLVIEDNQKLLALLLQHATQQPGVYFPPKLPKNQEWLKKASLKIKTDEWLKPRHKTIELNQKRYTLSLEEDPIEVLRMGVPFDTCLSLEDGGNAASTVLNALDVNKRVLYLRDSARTIVARQLIALSPELELLGYRLYSALEKELLPSLQQHFRSLCEEISREVGAPFGARGEPEKIHEGFWYDDGVVPFGGSVEAVFAATARYCAQLGLGLPKVPPRSLREEAEAWDAKEKGDVEAALLKLSAWNESPAHLALGAWIIEQLGEQEAIRRCLAGVKELRNHLLRSAIKRGLPSLLRVSQKIIKDSYDSEGLYEILRETPLQPQDLPALIKEAQRIISGSTRLNDHGLEHGLMYELPQYIYQMKILEIFEICDLVEPVWSWVIQKQESCQPCLESAEHQLLKASVAAYWKDPDAKAVVACLQENRRSLLARKVALRLTATFPMPQRAKVERDPFLWLERGITDAPWVRKVLLSLQRHPVLGGSPDLVAGLLRQGFLQVSELSSLPIPKEAPFASLADLQLHCPELLPWLAQRWPSPDVSAERWCPDVWELYFYRRHSTPWRKQLAREVEANTKHAKKAAEWLCLLGATETIEKLQSAQTSLRAKNKERSDSFHWSWDPHLLTEEILWQVRLSKETSNEEPFPNWQKPQKEKVDMALTRVALSVLSRRRAERRSFDDEPIDRALSALVYAKLPGWLLVEILERCWEESERPLGGALCRFLAGLFEQGLFRSLPVRWVLRIFAQAELRAPLLQAMTSFYSSQDVLRYHEQLCEAARAEGQDISELLSEWFSKLLAGGRASELASISEPGLLMMIFQTILQKNETHRLVEFYDELLDARSASLFLQELAKHPAHTNEAIEKAMPEDKDNWENRTMRFTWLKEFLIARGSYSAMA